MINEIVDQVKQNPNQIPIPTNYRRNIEKVLHYPKIISTENSFLFNEDRSYEALGFLKRRDGYCLLDEQTLINEMIHRRMNYLLKV